VSVAVREGSALLAVRDDGPGVPEDLRHRVFEPFFTTKPPGKGTGLGLHVAWRIVGRLGGSVRVEEASAGGAVFEVRLPAVAVDGPLQDVELEA
jgi:C4-dicarboxylate-specific signal transduction histidine kinase